MAITTEIAPPRGFNPDSKERVAIVEKILEQYSNANGRPNFVEAFRDHPHWAVQLGWSDKVYKGRGYALIAAVRNKRRRAGEANGSPQTNGHTKKRRKLGRHQWTQEQVSLVRQIEKDGRYRSGIGVNWTAVMIANPEWAQALNYDRPKAFQAFVTRVRHKPYWKGASTKNAATVIEAKPVAALPSALVKVPALPPGFVVVGMQDVIEIQGRQFAAKDVLQRMEDYSAKLCPECGLNLQWLHNSYNIARRHSAHLLKDE